MTEEGFVKAQSDNLPSVDAFMVASYIKNTESFSLSEVRGVKAGKSGRASYGDSAVGWVQIQRTGHICIVKAKITPEHNVRKKQYGVLCKIDENSEEILNLQCNDCAASSGGCKHAISFLMWIHRRSEEPSPTEIACYWAKSKLSKVGTTIKYITLKDFNAQEELSSDEDSEHFLKDVVEAGSHTEIQLLKYFKSDELTDHLGLHQLMIEFAKCAAPDYNNFRKFCMQKMNAKLCNEAAIKSTEQSKSGLWFDLRYGRITASKLYDAAHCKKTEGAFVNHLLGITKVFATNAMKRGQRLEGDVIKCLQEKLKTKLTRIGLLLNTNYPIFGASPDAICDEYVVEVKCPQFEKTVGNYITKDNEITAKCKAQVHLQMFFANKKRCLFCVADPEFEKNSKFSQIWIEYDREYMEMVIDAAECFWKNNIFLKLYNAANEE